MKRPVVFISLAVAIVTCGWILLDNASTDAPIMTKSNAQLTSTDNTRSTPTPGQYLTYRDGIIAETAGPKLLFFHASWCRQCRMIEDSIKAQGVPKGVSIIKVDYDSATALRAKYGVTQQTTFVKIDDNGTELKKFVAYNEPDIESVRRELL